MATPGVISVSLIPGWPTPVAGAREQLDFVLKDNGLGFSSIGPDGIHVGDVAIAQDFLATYVGSALELQWNKDQKQAQLDANLEANFNLIAFIRNGTLTPVTGTQVGNFLAGECSNYRTLRAQIAAATTVAQVNAININAGWPNNP